MKIHYILIIGLIFLSSLFVPEVPRDSVFTNCPHTFVKVYNDFHWWLYEYDCDGSLIDITPIDE